jgi:hypothetical protein
MHAKVRIFRSLTYIPLIAMALCASVASAQFTGSDADVRIRDLKKGAAAGFGEYSENINFNEQPVLESPVWLRYKSFTSPRSSSLVKYIDMKMMKNGSVGRCFEFNGVNATAGADWILWANVGTATAPSWNTVADDVPAGSPLVFTTLPHARIWVKGSVSDIPTRLRLSPFYENGNTTHMEVRIMDKGSISEADCANTTYPVVKLLDNTVTIINPQ